MEDSVISDLKPTKSDKADFARHQIWNNFCNQKFKACYLNIFNSRLRNIDLSLNFLVALATTGSVATWAIWKQLPWLWIGIVGISQLIIVAKPFFPYLRELRRLTELELFHDRFAFEGEKLWFKFQKSQSKNFDQEILKYRETLAKTFEKFHDVNVPKWNWLIVAARKQRNIYLKINYGITI